MVAFSWKWEKQDSVDYWCCEAMKTRLLVIGERKTWFYGKGEPLEQTWEHFKTYSLYMTGSWSVLHGVQTSIDLQVGMFLDVLPVFLGSGGVVERCGGMH